MTKCWPVGYKQKSPVAGNIPRTPFSSSLLPEFRLLVWVRRDHTLGWRRGEVEGVCAPGKSVGTAVDLALDNFPWTSVNVSHYGRLATLAVAESNPAAPPLMPCTTWLIPTFPTFSFSPEFKGPQKQVYPPTKEEQRRPHSLSLFSSPRCVILHTHVSLSINTFRGVEADEGNRFAPS